MTTERIAQLQDIIGEAGACSDRDCSCKRAVRDAREELEEARLDAADSTEALYKQAGFDRMSPTEQRYADGDR